MNTCTEVPAAHRVHASYSRGDLGSVRTVSIIGAGVMGRGIAEASVNAGIRVRISDINSAAAAGVADQILAARELQADRGSRLMGQSACPMISVVTDDAEVAEADLIIEAVAENVATKTAILTRIEPHLRGHTMVATNSSSIPIAQLAASLQDPSRFCGLHFCHPVRKRPLVEVVGADSTDLAVLDRAWRYATAIGMTPMAVRDSPGFLLNRLLVPYMNEALELLLDGAEIDALDRAAREFGMPLGPLTHFDEFGIDVALAVGRTLYRAFPDRIVPSELLVAMYKSGRLGRKSGSGFCLTPHDFAVTRLVPDVRTMIYERLRHPLNLRSEEIAHRLFLPMLLEATRVLEESLVESPAMIDTALQLGLGMTSSYRGLFAWADAIGTARIIDLLQPLQPLGKRFEPTRLLLSKAGKSKPPWRQC